MIRMRAMIGMLVAAGLTSALGAPAWAQSAGVQTNAIAAELAASPLPPERASVIPNPAAYTDSWLIDHYKQRTIGFSDYTSLDGKGVAFVGDSITEGGDWAALFPGVETRNFGIGGDRSDGVLARVSQVIAAKPGRIIVMIGTNDLASGYTLQAIAGNVEQAITDWKAALPQTQIVVESVLPRQAEYDDRIRELNVLLEQVARRQGAAWVDIHTPFTVNNDHLDPTVTADNLHLTAPGYERWRAILDACVRDGTCGS